MRRNVAIKNVTGLAPWIIDSHAPNWLPISYRHSFLKLTLRFICLHEKKKQRRIKCRCEHISNHVIPRRIALGWIVCLASVLNGVYAARLREVSVATQYRTVFDAFVHSSHSSNSRSLCTCVPPMFSVHAEPLEVDARFGIWHLFDRKRSFRCVCRENMLRIGQNVRPH